ncbi:MAG: hypothetical protein II928_03730 [Paludibacteraceae bacterium]|nr:hypothetical protein [Paludibacteraceae bacterium]
MNRLFKGILLTVFCVLTAQTAFASTALASEPTQRMSSSRLASQPSAARPQATMTSTSAYFNAKSTDVEVNTSYNWRIGAFGTSQMMSFSPLTSASTKRKYTRSASFGTAGMGGGAQLPAVAISSRNYDELTSGSSIGSSSIPQPRRNERDDPDNPADPPGMDTPVGDVPFVFFALLIVAFCAYRYKDKLTMKRSN